MVWLCELFCKKPYDPDHVLTAGNIKHLGSGPVVTENDTTDNKWESRIPDLDPPNVLNKKKNAVIAGPSEEVPALDGITEIYEKNDNAKELIKRAINKNDFLSNMMDEKRLEAVTMAMYPEEYQQDQYIIKEGETGDYLYISARGLYDVVKNNIVIGNFGAGMAFGELGILYKAKRFASVRAKTAAKVWILRRNVFNRIMIKLGRLERDENINFLRSVDALSDLCEEKFGQVADLLIRQFYTAGAQIITQGDEGDLFYIIRAGTVRIIKRDGDGPERVVNTLKRGDCFGEQALLNREKRLATVVAEPPGTECLTLNRVAFEQYLGTLEQIKILPPDAPPIDLPVANDVYSNIQFTDLQVIRTLGVGSYGRVQLVEHRESRQKFALKYLKKYEIILLNYEQHVYNEKDIMASCDSPFIVSLYKTFRDSRYLYFLMEACLGGDLWTVLNSNRYFDDNTSRFITACVIEGLGYMHARNMVYRDLKPENLMIDDRGYVKLVDFGFARRLLPSQKTNTFVGTPEYVAPEIILGKGHDRAADYWAIGILIHELLSGRPVFRGQNHVGTYNLIVRGIDTVIIPLKIQRIAQELIKKLCRRNPTERLGYARNGVQDIKDHGWFNGFSWEKIRDQTMKAPRLLSHPKEAFSEYPGDEESPPEETSGWDIYF